MQYRNAAMLVIGNEVLSGRTRDANGWHTAQRLFERGCRLAEIAVVPDEHAVIVATLNRLRHAYEAVITSGGIGPTHDDITMQAVADAFGVALAENPLIIKVMTDRYGEERMNDGRRRMARVPRGAKLIRCEKTIAPGAHIGNVYVLAGVPEIFVSQLDSILDRFGDSPYLRHEIEVALPESLFAAGLSEIQQQFADVEIGSYPGRCGPDPCGKICLSSKSAERLETAAATVQAMLATLVVDS